MKNVVYLSFLVLCRRLATQGRFAILAVNILLSLTFHRGLKKCTHVSSPVTKVLNTLFRISDKASVTFGRFTHVNVFFCSSASKWGIQRAVKHLKCMLFSLFYIFTLNFSQELLFWNLAKKKKKKKKKKKELWTSANFSCKSQLYKFHKYCST